jgi:hypothetical protein
MARRSRGLAKAAKALATADGVAHVAFFWMFAWRIVTAGVLGRPVAIVLALVAVVGLVTDVIGWMLVKHGGRTPAGTVGLWSIAASTALAALLLLLGSWTGG